MNPGAIVVNYDRGEFVCADALDETLNPGQVSSAAIDADLLKDADTGALSGSMLPYLKIYPKHIEKMELLPLAAADTQHVSIVDASKQAVDQVSDVIQYKTVGDLPAGYRDGHAE